MYKKSILFSAASAAGILTALAAGSAMAQSAPSPAVGAPAAAPTVEEVVVTGSRIVGTFTAPTPVTAVNSEQLQATAITTIAQGLQQLPAVNPGGGPTAGGGTGGGGQNFLALRGLGAGRTLTLVDGRRFTPSGPAGTVDSNLIPSGLVQRVDVVTGGASAAYGSDAVAGVINFILDKRFTGLKLSAHIGRSEHNDNKDYRATINGGTSLLDGRLHLLGSYEYYQNDGVKGDARDFRYTAANQVLDPADRTRYVRIPDLRQPYTTGGLMVIGAGGSAAANAQFLGVQFGPNGVPGPYSYGTYATDIGVTSGTQNGGDGFRVSTGQEIVRPLKRNTFFTRAQFDVTPDIQAFQEISYSATLSTFESSPTFHTLTIQRDNAYLARAAPSIVAQMTAAGVTRFSLNRLTLERGTTYQDNQNFTLRGIWGLEGEFRGWNWDVAYQDGQNRQKAPMVNNLNTVRMPLAADAVVNPANGSIVCRSTLTNPANGCVPFNPFGAGSPSEAALDYVLGYTPQFLTTTRQKAASANVSGKLFTLPAGDVSAAVGAEWRDLSVVTIADALYNAGQFRLINAQDFSGQYSVREAYAEVQVPIFADQPFADSFDLNVAARHTDYSTSGGVNTWKVGLNWKVLGDYRFRYTLSRDIRAPNLQELYATGRQNSIVVTDTLTNRTYNPVPNRTFGNADLVPEEADTMVIGTVYTPSWLPGFNMALDYWAIRINDAIGNVGGNNAVNQCNLSNQTSIICAFVTRDPITRAVIATRTSPANLTVNKADGVDFEASYALPLQDWITTFDPGSLSVRWLVGYRGQNVTISPLVPITLNSAGEQGNPHYRSTVSFNWRKDPWRVNLQARYVGEQIWDQTRTLGVDTDFQHIESDISYDGQISYQFKPGQEAYVNVQNILNQDPVYSPSPGGPHPTDTALYDQVGRMWTIGVRLSY